MRLNEHLEHPEGDVVFQHACKMGAGGDCLEAHRATGRPVVFWLKFKSPDAPAVKREAEEDWAK